jgi:hypothetical protein
VHDKVQMFRKQKNGLRTSETIRNIQQKTEKFSQNSMLLTYEAVVIQTRTTVKEIRIGKDILNTGIGMEDTVRT